MKMKSWTPLVMVGTMILFMVVLMLLFDYLVGGPSIIPMLYYMTGTSGAGMGSMMLIALLGLAGMVGMMYLMMRWMSGSQGPMSRLVGDEERAPSHVDSKNLDTMVFTLPDVSCQGCKMKIEAELVNLPGVDSVLVDVESKKAEVRLLKLPTQTEIEELLKKIGYPAQ